MNIKISQLLVRTKKTTEVINFSQTVTFIYGPISKGKSTVLRLIDFCLGGNLERTPAIQQEFISAELAIKIGNNNCLIERSATDNSYVRISWTNDESEELESIFAPIKADETQLINAEVYNLSDMLFHLSGISPIKVKQRSRDPESPLIRLSFRDIWWYSYLNQAELDSSFFRFGSPFKEKKSKDALKFFTGLYSERLANAENAYLSKLDEQRTKRNSAKEIRNFMKRFEFGSEIELRSQLNNSKTKLADTIQKLTVIEEQRNVQRHPTDALRIELRSLSAEIDSIRSAIIDLGISIEEQKSLRAELIMSKTKSHRLVQSSVILDEVSYHRCPQCGEPLPERGETDQCGLCGQQPNSQYYENKSQELESIRLDINNRIDQIGDSVSRRELELERLHRTLKNKSKEKIILDQQLQRDLAQYDSAYVESVKLLERETATLNERIKHLEKLIKLPTEIDQLELEAGQMQGMIDLLKTAMQGERDALNSADQNVSAIADEFKRILIAVNFPGISEADSIQIDTRNWKPYIFHGDVEWSFWECGSGGKKTLFNVCYALAVHAVALNRGLPVPNILIIDSPTKNISEDEDPKLVQSLYSEIYKIASTFMDDLQLILVDSDLVKPEQNFPGIQIRRMAGTAEEPSLISYYEGP